MLTWTEADSASTTLSNALRGRGVRCVVVVGPVVSAVPPGSGAAAVARSGVPPQKDRCPRELGREYEITAGVRAPSRVRTAPSLRLCRGLGTRRGERRMGFSTTARVIAANAPAPIANSRFCHGRSSRPATPAARTRTGQCHRYQEYDSFPIAWSGPSPRTLPGPNRGAAQPAMTTLRVPPTGGAQPSPGMRWTR
jgi:hypothetical protein